MQLSMLYGADGGGGSWEATLHRKKRKEHTKFQPLNYLNWYLFMRDEKVFFSLSTLCIFLYLFSNNFTAQLCCCCNSRFPFECVMFVRCALCWKVCNILLLCSRSTFCLLLPSLAIEKNLYVFERSEERQNSCIGGNEKNFKLNLMWYPSTFFIFFYQLPIFYNLIHVWKHRRTRRRWAKASKIDWEKRTVHKFNIHTYGDGERNQ